MQAVIRRRTCTGRSRALKYRSGAGFFGMRTSRPKHVGSGDSAIILGFLLRLGMLNALISEVSKSLRNSRASVPQMVLCHLTQHTRLAELPSPKAVSGHSNDFKHTSYIQMHMHRLKHLVCKCICSCSYTLLHERLLRQYHTRMFIYTGINTVVHWMFAHPHARAHKHTCMHACICMSVIYAHIYIYIYIYTYTQTSRRTDRQTDMVTVMEQYSDTLIINLYQTWLLRKSGNTAKRQ